MRFIVVLANTLPRPMTLITAEQWSRIYEPCVKQWIDFNRELYGDHTLYENPPAPVAFDPHCPPLKLSDHIRERLGKYHPFFDFIHAPFTHPLGTQISLVCINYCWDAYDTFVKKVISSILQHHPHHPKTVMYREKEQAHKRSSSSFPADDQLAALGIAVTDDDLLKSLAEIEPEWSPTHARKLLSVAKALRSIFVHHFGKPDYKLNRLLAEYQFDAVRIRNDQLEILIPLVRDVATVVQVQASAIERRRRGVYGQ